MATVAEPIGAARPSGRDMRLVIAASSAGTVFEWYTWGVVLVAFLVSWWGLPSGPPRDFADEA